MSQGRQVAAAQRARRLARTDPGPAQSDAARKRAAIEMIAEHEGSLKRTARRYSLDAEDAEDAYQRALEILLVKAPTTDPRELIRWTQTVIKHEALALRQSRERLLGYGGRKAAEGTSADLVALIPAGGDSPEEQVERREAIARSREALQALKPAELRALSLLAEGYSYAEIGEMTGFSQTKVNRCLAEGRERFRAFLSRSESGGRCAELRPLLSAFCDGEADAAAAAVLREHLRACAHCRAAIRAYRAAPRAAGALAPLPLAGRSLLDRLHDALSGLHSRLPGQGVAADSAVTQVAASGGARGAGMAGLAKLLAVCAGTAGGAAACVGAGVVPAPLDLTPDHPIASRPAPGAGVSTSGGEATATVPSPPPPAPGPRQSEPVPEEKAAAEPAGEFGP
jgi:RNA polymerase sigma factor (sigma-70 family)